MRWVEHELFSDNTSHLLEICQLRTLWMKIPPLLSLLPTHLPAPHTFTSKLSPCLVAPLFWRAAICLLYAERSSQPAALLSNCTPKWKPGRTPEGQRPRSLFSTLNGHIVPSPSEGAHEIFPKNLKPRLRSAHESNCYWALLGFWFFFFCLHCNRRNVGTCPEWSRPVGPSDEWAAMKGAPSWKKSKALGPFGELPALGTQPETFFFRSLVSWYAKHPPTEKCNLSWVCLIRGLFILLLNFELLLFNYQLKLHSKMD